MAKRDTRGRARANVVHAGQVVGVVHRPLAGSIPPAKLRATRGEADAGGTIPRRVHVPLHVGIVGEEITQPVEGTVKLVAIPSADQRPRFSLGIDLVDAATGAQHARHEAVAIGQPGEQVIFAPQPRDARLGEFGQLGLVAADDVERLAIGGGNDGVRAMFALSLEFAEQFGGFVGVAAIARPQPMQPQLGRLFPELHLFVHHHVQAVEGVQQSVGPADGVGDGFDLHRRSGFAHGHPVQSAVLVRDNQAALGVDAQVDPRPFGLLGNRVQPLDLEARGQLELVGRGRLRQVERRGLGGKGLLGEGEEILFPDGPVMPARTNRVVMGNALLFEMLVQFLDLRKNQLVGIATRDPQQPQLVPGRLGLGNIVGLRAPEIGPRERPDASEAVEVRQANQQRLGGPHRQTGDRAVGLAGLDRVGLLDVRDEVGQQILLERLEVEPVRRVVPRLAGEPQGHHHQQR